MFRNSTWRKSVNDLVSWHQDQALNTTIFILREFGPTGFLLKEEGETKNFKVCLGDPHKCTCSAFLKEKDLCKHICWVLLRKFRLPRDHEYSFQLGLVERTIAQVLQGEHSVQTPQPKEHSSEQKQSTAEEDGCVRQKEIATEDICPICQEELLKKRLPVSYCRYGCGNSVHISCMKIWADHQTRSETDTMVKCPLCREDFAPMKSLLQQVKNAAKLITAAERERLDRHLGIPCNNCNICPISGKCFKCMVCSSYHLCEECFQKKYHPQHSFAFRLRRTQKWQAVEHFYDQPVFQRNQESIFTVQNEVIPEHIVKMLPSVKVRQSSTLLEPGQQCRLCLKSFSLGQLVRQLPCNHKFHKACADKWLLQESNSCPIDGQVIYNPITWNKTTSTDKTTVTSPSQLQTQMMGQLQQELFVPGIGLSLKTEGSKGPYKPRNADECTSPPVTIQQDSVQNGLQCLHLNNLPTGGHGTKPGFLGQAKQKLQPKRNLRPFHQRKCYSSEPGRSEDDSMRHAVSANKIMSSTIRTPGLRHEDDLLNAERVELSAVKRIPDKKHEGLFVGVNPVRLDSALQCRASNHPKRKMSQRRPLYRRPTDNTETVVGIDPTLKMDGISMNNPIQGNKTTKL
uniref:Zinc finger, SWIM-type containing 2 n=1 Tax=Lepisosteus oculatus TaxID=7918 RepID=W5MQB2_LEPOC|nr:PREDICTED: E3 ubiquitin-protein ligase ZSWIM2 isoform X1 [Lepisosteus oculatus]